MIRNFFATPNIIGRLFIVLLFAGGIVYAGAFDGFVVETEASSCCGGGTSMDIFSSSSNNNDDDDPEDPEDPEDDGCSCGRSLCNNPDTCSNYRKGSCHDACKQNGSCCKGANFCSSAGACSPKKGNCNR